MKNKIRKKRCIADLSITDLIKKRENYNYLN